MLKITNNSLPRRFSCAHGVSKIGLVFIGPYLLIPAWDILSISCTIVIFVGWYGEALLGTLLHYLQQLHSIRIQLSSVLRVLTFDIMTDNLTTC